LVAVIGDAHALQQVGANMGLCLEAVDVKGPARWRWILTDGESGTVLVDHHVQLDESAREYRALADLHGYLRWHGAPDPDGRPLSEGTLLTELGAWVGGEVLGPTIGGTIAAAAAPVRVVVPAEAGFLLSWPLDLAHVDGVPLAERGEVGFVFEVPGRGAADPGDGKYAVGAALRMLAVFSGPDQVSALGLRRERFEMTRLIRDISVRQGRRIELRVLQYGTTRARLREAAAERGGWDVLHLSGHGDAGSFVLETAEGGPDPLSAAELAEILQPSRTCMKLVVASACASAAGMIVRTLRALGLDDVAAELAGQQREPSGPAVTALAQQLVQDLACPVVAMRYPVDDEFAIAFSKELYTSVFAGASDLGIAARVATLAAVASRPGVRLLSAVTPVVLAPHGNAPELAAPRGIPDASFAGAPLSSFPAEPTRLAGRTGVMAKARMALAPESRRTTVVLHGMAGSGKSACALELAYVHRDAFGVMIYWRAPDEDDKDGLALDQLAAAWESQLAATGVDSSTVDKITSLGVTDRFLPELNRLLTDHRVLVVLDNMDSLLTSDGRWRDSRWELFVAALTQHDGASRVILTSRVVPAKLPPQATVALPVYALSRDEAMLLACDLPNLGRLLHTDVIVPGEEEKADRRLVRSALEITQGLPGLLELAEAAAADRNNLEERLAAAEVATSRGALAGFLDEGASHITGKDVLSILARWTQTVLDTLPGSARLLAQFLACLSDDDRRLHVVLGNWDDVWRHLELPGEPPETLPLADRLSAAALVQADGDRYRLHPAVADVIRNTADDRLREAVNTELAAFWQTIAHQVMARDGDEDARTFVRASLAAATYLIRMRQFDNVSWLLNIATAHDVSPATVRAALPFLRRAAEITGNPEHVGAYAEVLGHIDTEKAEAFLRLALKQAETCKDYLAASRISEAVINRLAANGRLPEALRLTSRKADYTRKAALGPWSQLADAAQRLQILTHMGDLEQVMTEFPSIHSRMEGLPDAAGAAEAVSPQNIRELVYEIGRDIALAAGNWGSAIAFNAGVVDSARRRNVSDYDLARARVNDNGALIRLGRYEEADQLLRQCQHVFEGYQDFSHLAGVFSGRADLEDELGHGGTAIQFGRTALRLRYAYGRDPAAIATDHYNLAIYLRKLRVDPVEHRAHRLAAGLIAGLAGMADRFRAAIDGLAADLHEDIGPTQVPGSLAEVTYWVEETDGVCFAALVSSLTADPRAAEDLLGEILTTARIAAMGGPAFPW
jgi:tetratricopeptide (TPR) repeat protein